MFENWLHLIQINYKLSKTKFPLNNKSTKILTEISQINCISIKLN